MKYKNEIIVDPKHNHKYNNLPKDPIDLTLKGKDFD
jgi:hypothetical protein